MVLKSESSTDSPTLDHTFSTRPVTMDDLQTATDLFNASDRPFYETDQYNVEDLRAEWTNPHFSIEKSTRAVFNEAGNMVGYIEIYDTSSMPVRPFMWGRIHPDYEGHGIGTFLFEWAENRAKEVFARVPEDAAVTLNAECLDKKTDSRRFLEDMGMTTNRASYLMLIEMDSSPDAPALPEGIRIIPATEYAGERANIYRAVRGSFQDHRGFVEEAFETAFGRWNNFWTNDPHYDPAVWLLAMDGDQIIGVSLCRTQSHHGEDRGHVMQLGVIRDYRRRGIAMGLLVETFRTFWARGKTKVDLGVDGSSLTNAVALYERAGMHIDHHYLMYEKSLRDGKEYSKQ